MATASVTLKRPVQTDRIFFPVLLGILLIVVWLGFSKTYYAAGMVRATLPAPIIHVHAFLATLWLLTLIVQVGLVTARKVKLHMTVGLFGFALAALLFPVSLLAARNSLQRQMSPPGSGLDYRTFFVVPVTGALFFAICAATSFALRRKPLAHKRLIMIATIAIVEAAVGRFPGTVWPSLTGIRQSFLIFALLGLMVVYDAISLRRVPKATWIPSLALVIMHLTRFPLAMTPAWLKFAEFVKG